MMMLLAWLAVAAAVAWAVYTYLIGPALAVRKFARAPVANEFGNDFLSYRAAEAAAKNGEAAIKRVAVVGGGIGGISAAWELEKRYGAEVTIFEAEAELGGHTKTVVLDDGVTVDLGFQISNPYHYPRMYQWFNELGGVALRETANTLGVYSAVTGYGWASQVACVARNLFSLRYWRMIVDMIRFHRRALGYLEEADMSVTEFVAAHGYSEAFQEDYVVPVVASLWSCPYSMARDCSMHFVISFFRNHHMLTIFDRPVWMTLVGGSSTYLRRFEAKFAGSVRTGDPVARVVNHKAVTTADRWEVVTASGASSTFDAVVMATHAPTSLEILDAGGVPLTTAQRAVIDDLGYYKSRVYLHTDASLMPPERSLWASWNSLTLESGEVVCTYWINSLQCPDYTARNLFVTIVPAGSSEACNPAPATMLMDMLSWEHPRMDLASMRARREVEHIQNPREGLVFCGAWVQNGFHEAAFSSGVAAANLLFLSDPVAAEATPGFEVRTEYPWEQLARHLVTASFAETFAGNGAELSVVTEYPPYDTFVVAGGKVRRQTAADVLARERKGVEDGDGGDRLAMHVRSPVAFVRMAVGNDLGFAESLLRGEVAYRNVPEMLRAVIDASKTRGDDDRGIDFRHHPLARAAIRVVTRVLAYLENRHHKNTVHNTGRNIAAHYDLGNGLFEAFLDDTMSYSCGVYASPHSTLADAQQLKIEMLADKAGVNAGDSVLEIGCGWGALSRHLAARHGARVEGITLSREQLALCRDRLASGGLPDGAPAPVYELIDYRHKADAVRAAISSGSMQPYDAVVSCEMIEAVGDEYLPEYFRSIADVLRPGGRCVIQMIAIPERRYKAYVNGVDFIQRYVFPGGHLPSLARCMEAMNSSAPSLVVDNVEELGPHYARTLLDWREQFNAKWGHIWSLGSYDDRFRRMWTYYLDYCEVAFETGAILEYQLVLRKANGGL